MRVLDKPSKTFFTLTISDVVIYIKYIGYLLCNNPSAGT